MTLHFVNPSPSPIAAPPVVVPSLSEVAALSNVAIGGGGFVTGIAFDVGGTPYLKTDVGGAYRLVPREGSTQRWIALLDWVPPHRSNLFGVDSLALDPSVVGKVYASLGKYTWAGNGTFATSADGGTTWNEYSLPTPVGANESKRWAGERLSLNRWQPQQMLLGTRSAGLLYSENGGQTWGQVSSLPVPVNTDVGVTATHWDRLGAWALVEDSGVWRSADGLTGWQLIPGSPSKPYQIEVLSNGLGAVVTHALGVSRYYTSANSWLDITPPEAAGKPFNALALSPDGLVLASPYSTSRTPIYKSEDLGSSWSEMPTQKSGTVPWWDGYMEDWQAVSRLAFDPREPSRVWLTDWFGVWTTGDYTDAPTLWMNVETGHEELVIFDLLALPDGTLLSGAADVDGFRHEDTTVYPQRKHSGKQDTYDLASTLDGSVVTRVWGNRWNDTYGGATSTDGGISWTDWTGYTTSVAALEVASNALNPQHLVVLRDRTTPIRSGDGGNTFTVVAGLPNGGRAPWYWGRTLSSAPTGGFYAYAGTTLYYSPSGAVFTPEVSGFPTDHGYKWLDISPLGRVWLSLGDAGLFTVAPDSTSPVRVAGIYEALTFALQGETPYLYGYRQAGAEAQLLVGDSTGSSWSEIPLPHPIGNEPNSMAVAPDGTVYVGTNGRGIFQINQPMP